MSILDEVESELKTVHGAGATGDPEQDPAMQKIMRALATVRARRGSSKQSNMAQDLFLQQQQQQQQQQTQSTLPNQAQSPSSQWQPEQQFLQGLPPAEASDATHLLGETPSADPGAGDSFNTLFAPLSFEALKPSQAAARPPLDQNVSGNPYPTPSTDTTPFAAPFFSSPAHPLASPFHATFNGEMTPGAPQSLLSPYAHTVAASELFLSPYSDLGASPYSPYDASDYGGSDVSYQEDGLQDLMNILNSPLPPFTDETGLQSSSSSSVGPSGGVGTTSGGTGTTRKPSASPATGPRPPRPSISKRPRVKRTNTTTPKTAPTDPEAPNTSSSSSMQLPKLYPCTFPDCTKTFTRSYNLKSHSLLHTGIKPFACAGCPATFLRKHDRDRHFNSLHGGASGRRFKCELCGAGFARADALRRHVEVEERTGAPGGHGHGGDGEKEGSAGYSQDDRHTVDDAGKDGGAALSFMDQLQGGGHAPADESLESLVLGPTASGPTGAGTSMNALGYRLESGL
ncbi:hypothetical protein HKX48_007193 [Thoreauomyces humboldtii]|nr:hypothetical protein HKX48_007193 [Thoreauomyces humboldtii]